MSRRLWRDGMVYAVGGVLARAVGLLTLPLLVRSLAPADYGALDLITTIGVLVNLVLPLEISQGLARLWNERHEGAPRRRLAGTAWTFTLASHAAFVIVCSLASTPIAAALLGDSGFASAVRAGCCAIAFNNAFYLLQNQFRWELRPRAYAAATVGYALANLSLLAMFLWAFGPELDVVLWAQAVAAGATTFTCYTWLRRSYLFGISRAELAAMLRFSLPLVPAGIAVFTSFYVNRLMLNGLGTLQDVGLFGLASRLASVVTLVLVGIQAVTPWVYAHYREPDAPTLLARLFEGFTAFALVGSLALGVFASELVLLLATPAYLKAAPLVTWLCAASVLAQLYVFTPGITIAKKTHWQLAITLSSAVTGVALNALLIPKWGVSGAAAATVAAGAVFFGGWAVAGQRLYALPLRRGPLAAAAGLFVVLGLAVPQLDAVLLPGLLRMLVKASVLLTFVLALFAVGLLQLRTWRGALVSRQ